MSESTTNVDDKTRANAERALKKLFPDHEHLAEKIEQSLYRVFPDSTSYRSGFRRVTSLLKGKSLDAPMGAINTTGANTAKQRDFITDLHSKKLTIANFIKHVQKLEDQESNNSNTTSTSSDSSESFSSLVAASQSKHVHEQRSQLLCSRIRSAKQAVESDVRSDDAWAHLGDTSMDMFYKLVPNLAFLQQAIKAYAHMSQAFLTSHPLYHVKLSWLHVILESYDASILAWRAYGAVDSSHAAVSAQHIDAIERYVTACASSVESRGGLSPSKLNSFVKDIPNQKQVTSRNQVNSDQLVEGANEQSFITLKVIRALNVPNNELHTLQNQSPSLPFTASSNVLSEFPTPLSYVVCDRDARVLLLSLYNTLGKRVFDKGDLITVLAPTLKHIQLRTQQANIQYPAIHALNPNYIFVNFKVYAEDDIAHFIQ